MAYAINIRSDNATSDRLKSLWDRCAVLENSPSMQALQYPPHITLAVYDDVPRNDLYAGFESALAHLKKITIRFESLGYFEAPHAIILWASPTIPEQVTTAHASIHSMIDTDLCRNNYRPGIWVPHSSLATSVPLSRKDEALAIVERSIDPFEVVFDMADCASYPPVAILKEIVLVP